MNWRSASVGSRIIFLFMTLSGAIACLIGYTAAWPWYIVVLLMMLHYSAMLGDSAALTSGAVASNRRKCAAR